MPPVPHLPPHLAERAHLAHRRDAAPAGRCVLYWTHHAARAHENPALDAARHLAAHLRLPLLVYAGLGGRHPFNNDRHHTFILEGLRDLHAQLRALGLGLRVHVPTDPCAPSPLRALAAEAAVVVTEDFPAPPFPRWTDALERHTPAPVLRVDTACVVPMRTIGRAHDRAFAFRNAAWDEFLGRVATPWPDEAPDTEPYDAALPFEPVDLDTADLHELIARCRIDHTIPPVGHTPGGSAAAYERWRRFRDQRLPHYHARRNDAADLDAVSRLSPYLHHGMASPLRIAREAHATRTRGAEKFLDELFVWRELAHNLALHRSAALHDLRVLPGWAQRTLAEHADDPRPSLYTHEQLLRARTDDTLWNLAQSSLLRQGELHNNLRMTWAKMIPLWSPTPAEALVRLIDLNHRLALDGSDPNSYGGLLWALGLFDRPFPPPRPVLGTVRPRDTDTHATRLDLDRYRALATRTTRTLRVAVIGAGIAGLAAARAMADQGHAVTVLEKARGPGGRTATRHADPYRFDHGAQYFTARDERFARHIPSWLEAGVIAPYHPRLAEIDDSGVRMKADSSTPRYVGTPGMNALARHLAEGVDLRTAHTITRAEHDGQRWTLHLDDRTLGPFDALVCTAPPAQAARLFAETASPMLAALAAVEMAPCWALMLGFDRTLDTPFDAAFVNSGPLSWIARHHPARPGRPPIEAWTLHASPAFSTEHLERDPDEIARTLTAAFRALTGAPEPVHAVAHRWRYALPTSGALDTECLWDASRAVALAGDWATAGRVEGAFLSGCAAAGRVLALAATPR